MAAASSASEQSKHMPLAGIPGVIPATVTCSKASRPLAMRGAQASASPGFGAPAIPGVWQEKQYRS